MTNKTIAVVIPAYNAETFIEDALDSVALQNLQPTELIVVDDGSRDRTHDVVAAWRDRAKPPFRVHIVKQPNGGSPNARNAGISRACADWIALLDADDIWEPEHLSVLCNAVERESGVVAAYGAGRLLVGDELAQTPYDEFWDNPSRLHGLPVGPGSQCLRIGFAAFPRLIRGNFIKPSSLMFSRRTATSIGLFNESLRTAEDREFMVRLLRQGDFVYSPTSITQ